MYELIKNIKLEDLGYSEYFQSKSQLSVDTDFSLARIISEHKGRYLLRNEASVLSGKISGKMKFDARYREDYPAVGDWVLIKIISTDHACIYEILPRKTILKRKSANVSEAQVLATNIDTAFIIQAPDRDYSLNRFERYFALAKSGNVTPAIILNKTDLLSKSELEKILSEIKNRFHNTNVYPTSTISDDGLSDLKESIEKGKTYCLLGSSGVGKSSIVNTLMGEFLMDIGEIGERANRGRHITTHRELFLLESGGLLIDTPGLREIGVLDSSVGIKDTFSEIERLSHNCKFPDCTHQHENDCAVLDAVKNGTLDSDKYKNYIKLIKEDAFNSMSSRQKKEKNKTFGKFIKTSKNNSKSLNLIIKSRF